MLYLLQCFFTRIPDVTANEKSAPKLSEFFNFVYLKLLFFHFRLSRATSFAGCCLSLGDIDWSTVSRVRSDLLSKKEEPSMVCSFVIEGRSK